MKFFYQVNIEPDHIDLGLAQLCLQPESWEDLNSWTEVPLHPFNFQK